MICLDGGVLAEEDNIYNERGAKEDRFINKQCEKMHCVPANIIPEHHGRKCRMVSMALGAREFERHLTAISRYISPADTLFKR